MAPYQGTAHQSILPKKWQLMVKTDQEFTWLWGLTALYTPIIKNKKPFYTQNTRKEDKDIDWTNLLFSLCFLFFFFI